VRRERWETCQGGWLIGNSNGFLSFSASSQIVAVHTMPPIAAATAGFSCSTHAEPKLDLDAQFAILSLSEQQKP
jgi:hypothetical protein